MAKLWLSREAKDHSMEIMPRTTPLPPAEGGDAWFPGYRGPWLDTYEQKEESSCCQVQSHHEAQPNPGCALLSSLGLSFLLYKMGIMTEICLLGLQG